MLSSSSKMRSAPARASCAIVSMLANIRTGATSDSMYVENARNTPRVMSPCSASQPPSASTATMPNAGMVCSSDWSRAVIRTSRRRDPNSSSDVLVSWSSWRCSCPKPFTMRTPVTDSSTTVATSPASCWESQLAGKMPLRRRRVVHSSAGVTSSITSVSGGDRNSMIPSEITNMRMLPITIGRNCSRPWISMMSEPARLTS